MPDEGPIGGQGSAHATALDRGRPHIWSYGLPFWIDAALPWDGASASAFRRLMVAQDTGSAILARPGPISSSAPAMRRAPGPAASATRRAYRAVAPRREVDPGGGTDGRLAPHRGRHRDLAQGGADRRAAAGAAVPAAGAARAAGLPAQPSPEPSRRATAPSYTPPMSVPRAPPAGGLRAPLQEESGGRARRHRR